MYNEKVMELIRNPIHTGEMKNADAVGEIGNLNCGDILRVYLKIENNVIVDASFMTYGCGAAIASSCMAMEMVIGKTLDEAYQIKNSDVIEALGELPSIKIHCSVLASDAIRSAIDNYRKK